MKASRGLGFCSFFAHEGLRGVGLGDKVIGLRVAVFC